MWPKSRVRPTQIRGRLDKEPNAKLARKLGLTAFDFDEGTILFTEAGSKKWAAIHLIRSEDISEFDRGGLKVFETDIDGFLEHLFVENHTLKRSLTDPRLYSGIGNAYSDEILHRAGLSPRKHSTKLTDEEVDMLYHATLETLAGWKSLLLEEVGDGFPNKVTAFHKQMAVHGKYGKPRPVCDSPCSAHPLRAERMQLLCNLPDGQEGARRPRAVSSAEARLAGDPRGAGRAEETEDVNHRGGSTKTRRRKTLLCNETPFALRGGRGDWTDCR